MTAMGTNTEIFPPWLSFSLLAMLLAIGLFTIIGMMRSVARLQSRVPLEDEPLPMAESECEQMYELANLLAKVDAWYHLNERKEQGYLVANEGTWDRLRELLQ